MVLSTDKFASSISLFGPIFIPVDWASLGCLVQTCQVQSMQFRRLFVFAKTLIKSMIKFYWSAVAGKTKAPIALLVDSFVNKWVFILILGRFSCLLNFLVRG